MHEQGAGGGEDRRRGRRADSLLSTEQDLGLDPTLKS